MSTYKAEYISDALPILAKDLLKKGVTQECRSNKAGNSAIRFKKPLLLEIKHPDHHNIWLKERKWNSTLAYTEILWIMLGWNNLDDLTGRYVKNLYNFSDDGRTWRGGYGPRIRSYSPGTEQYDIGETTVVPGFSVDQLQYIFSELKSNPNSRQATITISDPLRDIYSPEGKRIETKDYPCTRELIFELDENSNELSLTVVMRSNDLHWGFSAVNFFNFSMMQEILARMLGCKIGKYYHFAVNFHFYSSSREMLQKLSCYDPENVVSTEPKREPLEESKGFDMIRFENVLKLIRDVENYSYLGDFNNAVKAQTMLDRMDEKIYGFFADWARVLLRHNTKNNDIRKDKKMIPLLKFSDPYMTNTLGA